MRSASLNTVTKELTGTKNCSFRWYIMKLHTRGTLGSRDYIVLQSVIHCRAPLTSWPGTAAFLVLSKDKIASHSWCRVEFILVVKVRY